MLTHWLNVIYSSKSVLTLFLKKTLSNLSYSLRSNYYHGSFDTRAKNKNCAT